MLCALPLQHCKAVHDPLRRALLAAPTDLQHPVATAARAC